MCGERSVGDLGLNLKEIFVVFSAKLKHFLKFEAKHNNAVEIGFVFAPIIECLGVDLQDSGDVAL